MNVERASPDGDVAHIEVLHVVRTLHVVVDHALPGAAERLDGINLSFLQGATNTTRVNLQRKLSMSNQVHIFIF